MRIERLLIFGPEIARRLHAEQQDRHMRGFELGQDGGEVLFGQRGIDAAQRVVRTHLHDGGVGMIGQRPVEPRQPVRRRVAGDAGIDDRGIDARLLQPLLQHDREFGARRQAVALRQARAEGQNLDRLHLDRPRGGRGCDKRQRQQ